MTIKSSALAILLAAGLVSLPQLASAGAKDVGLGIAAGMAYTTNEVEHSGGNDRMPPRFAWGFFVDIPLLETFYITPAAMLYDWEDANGDRVNATDVDLNFKFIVPIGDLRVGAGLTGGLSTGLQLDYAPHYGLLGFVSYNLVSNLDAFALVQYKKMVRDELTDMNDIHGFLGAMFRFQ